MNETSNIVRGIAGDVEVTIRPVPSEAPKETLWQMMQRTRAELEAAGHRFRTKEEIDADIEDLRDWDGKIDEVDRPTHDTRPARFTGIAVEPLP